MEIEINKSFEGGWNLKEGEAKCKKQPTNRLASLLERLMKQNIVTSNLKILTNSSSMPRSNKLYNKFMIFE